MGQTGKLQQDARASDRSRFKAFVSYSHADKAAAQKLHRKLETYRLPEHLRSGDVEFARDGRIGAIFRDREDLPAAQDLTESVKKALGASEALVVLCSPDAKASPWVAREIELFREIHPDRPVLAALLRGEPAEAFPAILSEGSEPLAADLRKEGDGPRLGFLKVVAGIANVPLDSLVNRDAQRRIRRVTAITVASLAAMLVMALMTTFALQSRNEAQHQQAEAEGLVEYMLTELRDDLDGAAGLAVMTKVNKRALVYYENQGDLDSLPPDSLERRARAIGQLGEDAQNREDYVLARQNFEERYRTTARLLAGDPQNSDRQFDHALSLNRLALIAQAQGKDREAESQLRQSWSLLTRLEAWDAHAIEWQRAAVLVAGNLCAIDTLRNQVDGASLEKCELSVNLGRQLMMLDHSQSQDAYNLVFNLIWLGDCLEKRNEQARATAARNESISLTKRLSLENPDNLKIRSQEMEVYGYLSRYQPPDIAKQMLIKAISIASELTQRDPERAAWRTNIRNYRKRLGEYQ